MKRTAVATLILSFCAWPIGAEPTGQIVLPPSMKGDSDYQGRVHSDWSLQVTKVNDDGSFEGLLTYAGRACTANGTAISNGTVRDGVVRFKASMGARCSENVFTLRRGKDHFLEGELESNVAPAAARIWLDPAN